MDSVLSLPLNPPCQTSGGGGNESESLFGPFFGGGGGGASNPKPEPLDPKGVPHEGSRIFAGFAATSGTPEVRSTIGLGAKTPWKGMGGIGFRV